MNLNSRLDDVDPQGSVVGLGSPIRSSAVDPVIGPDTEGLSPGFHKQSNGMMMYVPDPKVLGPDGQVTIYYDHSSPRGSWGMGVAGPRGGWVTIGYGTAKEPVEPDWVTISHSTAKEPDEPVLDEPEEDTTEVLNCDSRRPTVFYVVKTYSIIQWIRGWRADTRNWYMTGIEPGDNLPTTGDFLERTSEDPAEVLRAAPEFDKWLPALMEQK